jgi:alpha-L-fucosidase
VRFTQSKNGKTLYAVVMGAPTNAVTIKSLGTNAKLLEKKISKITLLGSKEKLKWTQTAEALTLEAPQAKPSDIALVFRIALKG